MSTDLTEPLTFKFHLLNDQGHQTSFFRKRGSFDGETLRLDGVPLPAAGMLQTAVRENRMVILYVTAEGDIAQVALMPTSKKTTDELKRRLDIARSGAWARMHREELKQRGRGDAYRDARCPRCTATVILTDLPPSPQLYCPFCDSLTTTEAVLGPIAGEESLRLCEECGMYSQPRKFTIFYFYFLLVVYGWWNQATWRCPGCMRREAWKMFFGNLLFLLGAPVALVQLLRCYSGAIVGGAFRGLDSANLKARRGDVRGALAGYRSILERVPHSAGIKYNLALALLQQGDEPRAAEALELALADCANYVPAYQLLKGVYTRLGATERLHELTAMWEDVEEARSEPEGGGAAGRGVAIMTAAPGAGQGTPVGTSREVGDVAG